MLDTQLEVEVGAIDRDDRLRARRIPIGAFMERSEQVLVEAMESLGKDPFEFAIYDLGLVAVQRVGPVQPFGKGLERNYQKLRRNALAFARQNVAVVRVVRRVQVDERFGRDLDLPCEFARALGNGRSEVDLGRLASHVDRVPPDDLPDPFVDLATTRLVLSGPLLVQEGDVPISVGILSGNDEG